MNSTDDLYADLEAMKAWREDLLCPECGAVLIHGPRQRWEGVTCKTCNSLVDYHWTRTKGYFDVQVVTKNYVDPNMQCPRCGEMATDEFGGDGHRVMCRSCHHSYEAVSEGIQLLRLPKLTLKKAVEPKPEPKPVEDKPFSEMGWWEIAIRGEA